MEEIFAVALQSMHHDKLRLERVGMNLANAMTPAYKRETVVARPFYDMVSAARSEPVHAAISTITQGMVREGRLHGITQHVGVNRTEILTDNRRGTLKPTGQSLDLALAGDGYFEVIMETGPAYTRQGNFRLDERGRLVTAQGYPVMGKTGEIVLTSLKPVIDAAGNITEIGSDGSGQSVLSAQIKVVTFEDERRLERLGEGLVAAGPGMAQAMDADVQIRQGFLENANVNSMYEMVQLIQTMRHFESMQKAVQGYDEMIGSAIRKLSES